MAKGLKVPVGVNEAGGAAMVDADDDLAKIIMLALSPGYSRNPFQKLGMDEGIIFDTGTARTMASIQLSIEAIFKRLEASNRAALDDNGLIMEMDEGTMEMRATVSYINLETQLPGEFGLSFQQGNVGVVRSEL
jgi:hypothetical protein